MNIYRQLDNIGEGILENFQYAENARRHGRSITRERLSDLIDLSESFSSLSRYIGDPDLIQESLSYEDVVRKMIIENKCGRLLEGFYNPFDSFEDEYIEDVPMPEPQPKEEDKGIKIRRIRVWNPDGTDRVSYVNGKMMAGKYIGRGDIVEKCPCRILDGSDLYSRGIRDIAFPIDSVRRTFAIPFGKAIFYRNSKQFGIEPNAFYEYNDVKGSPFINIIAFKKINKGDEIVLRSDDTDFENDIMISRVNPRGYVSTKSFKIV